MQKCHNGTPICMKSNMEIFFTNWKQDIFVLSETSKTLTPKYMHEIQLPS